MQIVIENSIISEIPEDRGSNPLRAIFLYYKSILVIMKFKLLFLILFVFLLCIGVAQAGNCSNGFCDANEDTTNCCVDCGCPGNQTCWGVPGVSDDQKSCVDPFCGDGFCDETLDHNSIPNERWDNCCDDCGCHGSDVWEAEKIAEYSFLYYRATDDVCYDNRCDGCHIDQHCNDSDDCTIDECLDTGYLNKSLCYNSPITECISGDGCCAPGCLYADDTDCIGKCGDNKCEAPEDCSNCYADCGCDRGQECIGGSCQGSTSYCEVKGAVTSGKFCNGINWVKQFDLGSSCDYNYECATYLCKNSVCSYEKVSKETRAYFTRIGLLGVALACLVAYFIIVISKFREKNQSL